MAVTVERAPRKGDLTPKEIQWCRKWIPKFAEANDAVIKSDKWAAEIRAKLEPKQ